MSIIIVGVGPAEFDGEIEMHLMLMCDILSLACKGADLSIYSE